MTFENFIKGPITTTFGICIMVLTLFGWYTHRLSDWQGGGGELVGFALLFMRDKLPEFITEFFNALLNKYFNNKPKQ